MATGCQVHIAWVSRRLASLQLMCRLQIHSQLRGGETQVAALPLPPRIKALIANLFAQTIRVSYLITCTYNSYRIIISYTFSVQK